METWHNCSVRLLLPQRVSLGKYKDEYSSKKSSLPTNALATSQFLYFNNGRIYGKNKGGLCDDEMVSYTCLLYGILKFLFLSECMTLALTCSLAPPVYHLPRYPTLFYHPVNSHPSAGCVRSAPYPPACCVRSALYNTPRARQRANITLTLTTNQKHFLQKRDGFRESKWLAKDILEIYTRSIYLGPDRPN